MAMGPFSTDITITYTFFLPIFLIIELILEEIKIYYVQKLKKNPY